MEAFCSVASGSGMTDLADRSHCKSKEGADEPISTFTIHTKSVMCSTLRWCGHGPLPHLPGAPASRLKGKLLFHGTEREVLKTSEPETCFWNPCNPTPVYITGICLKSSGGRGSLLLSNVLRHWVFSAEYWEQANGLHGSQVRSQVPAGICF